MGTESEHWNGVYRSKVPEDVSWHQSEPAMSLVALDRMGLGADASIVDVGGGASRLPAALLARGFRDITILDIAASALDAARERLGEARDEVDWQVADVTAWNPARTFDIWHDRAVFHFLTEQWQRDAYRKTLLQALKPGGTLIIATFALDGPERCSGLPVRRYDPEMLAAEFGPPFEIAGDWQEDHVTPWGSVQHFCWCAFRRTEAA
ncbi:class I SAM-dependent methyltransferase [Sphingopyxis indica]|jgi:SAM-dependent methyltransferase|uniref:Methyltransferase domain-containing protein n=2 Tax=Sphingopyxis TaxID=165697 RepID=A0A239KAR0_9SPHN|nr:class I SAM-dependent methyltransferase [Sphingopyxis indica]KTE18372.1 SAM-dependent methyltransferase [Sphingopyxis sp. H050]SNT14743.1 Methyltransferase domain-containing protein [Sphingopyxis indica]